MQGGRNTKVTFQYQVASDYKVFSINGVQGGLNARGEIIVNIFSERPPIASRVTHEIDDQGRLVDPPIEIETTQDIIRDVYCGMALSSNDARAIARWLETQADEFDKRFQKKAYET